MVVVVPVPVMLSVIPAEEPTAELPALVGRVIVNVAGGEKEAPGARLGGTGPNEVVNSLLAGNIPTLGVERVAAILPVFSTTYEITTESPGAKGPTLKVAAPDGRAERPVKRV